MTKLVRWAFHLLSIPALCLCLSAVAQTPKKEQDPEIMKLQVKLSSHFGTKVQIASADNSKGQIKIPFTSTEELNRILDILDV